jgi:hypothetical protein
MTIRIATLVSVVLLSACAATPPPAPSTPEDVAADARQKQLIQMASRLGYRVEVVKSERHYCHEETPTGSRVARKECLNESEMITRLSDGDNLNQRPNVQIDNRNASAQQATVGGK